MAGMAVIAAVSAVVGALGAIQQGQTAAKVAEYNARLAEVDAANTRSSAAFEERRQREQVRRFLSSQRAAAGASGITAEGSPLLLFQETAVEGELDALSIRRAGSIAEQRSIAEAAGQRMQGRAAKTAGFLKAGQALLGGVSRVGRAMKLGDSGGNDAAVYNAMAT